MDEPEYMEDYMNVISESEVLGKKLIIYGDLENPLFSAKDILELINQEKLSIVLENVDDVEKTIQKMVILGQSCEVWFLTGYGLYELLIQSENPIAKNLEREIKEILRDLRFSRARIYEKSLPKNYEEALEELLSHVKENRLLRQSIKI